MIRFQRPQLPPVAEIAAYYERAEHARWYSNFGPCHALLVERLQARLGPPLSVIPVANCTLGLSLALKATAHGQSGDEILLPSFTFAATAAAVEWAGFKPVFVDVDPGHWSLDPARLADALEARGDRVAGILACTTFGAPPPVAVSDAWEALASQAGVPLVVDSAAGLGAVDARGRQAGHLGDAEVFSLHATKPFAIGEGGIVTASDPDVAERIRRLANFGFQDGVVAEEVGINAKLAEWPAATALAVLDGFDDVLAVRRSTAAFVDEQLATSGLTFQTLDAQPAWQFVPALAPTSASRDDVVAIAAEHGVEVRTYFAHPLHTMPPFGGAPRTDDLTVTLDLASRALSLPMANDLSIEEQDTIITTVRRALTMAVAR